MKNFQRQILNKTDNKIDKINNFNSSKNDYLSNSNINNINQYYSLNNNNDIKNNSNNEQKKNNNILNNKNNNNNNNNNIDPRIITTLTKLNIEKIIPIIINNNITFNDLLILTRKNLIDLGFPMLERNRILSFSQKFIKFTNNYTLEEINSFFQKYKNLYDKSIINNNSINMKIKNQKNEETQLYYSKGFDSYNNNFSLNKLDKEKDSQNEIEYCNIYPKGPISLSRTNTSSKNNFNSNNSKINYFVKYQELTQEVDNYINKFKEYKQNWNDSKNKYENLMNSYLVRGKTVAVINKKNKNKNLKNQLRKNKSKIDKESFEKLKLLKERKEELKKQLDKIRDKSNHKKMIIKYLEEN
jgi:hypothetical protein